MLRLSSNFVTEFNRLFQKKVPFLFVISYDGSKTDIVPLEFVRPEEILYSFDRKPDKLTNSVEYSASGKIRYSSSSPCFKRYERACRYIMEEQERGDSYLANLTFPSAFRTENSLLDIFQASSARYKLYYRNQFVIFSPEQFVRIENGHISTAPMKGTIDASLPGASEMLLNDPKESAEHLTIVDLLRNDLSRVCEDVEVEKYRYIEKITTRGKDLLQSSSLISGELAKEYRNHPGEIFKHLLPAGSITGAPKKRTIEIISRAEAYDRGYYTGVMGCFDGRVIDSAVMIRYIENCGGKFYYKSGGGITIYSDPGSEFQELKDKVYVPVR